MSFIYSYSHLFIHILIFDCLNIRRYLLNQVKDMQELVKMSKHQLERILGSDSNAQLLWQFFHSKLNS